MTLDNTALIFTDLGQVRQGLLWADRRQTNLAHYQSLWRNDSRGTAAEPVRVRFNWYRRVTEFWGDALWGRKPIGVSEAVAIAFEEGTRWRSMKGNGVVIVDADGTLRPIDPQQWYPVYDPVDNQRITGHIIAYFWRDGQTPAMSESILPNRVDFLLLDGSNGDRAGRRASHRLEGHTVGALLDERDAAVQGLVHWGSDYSDYIDLEDVVNAVEKRYSRIDRVLDMHSDPHLQGPAAALDANGSFRFDTDGNSLFLPLDDADTPRYEYLVWDGALDPQRAMLNVLLDAIHTATSIPATAFGLGDDNGSATSGVSRERQLFAALQKLRRLRREITPALLTVNRLTGGASELNWPSAPFESYSDLASAVAKLVQETIITEDAALAILEA